MIRPFKLAVLYFLRAVGIFAVARHLTRKRLRILCYHGSSVGDQHEFEPFLFMRGETLERRMALLRTKRWQVIGLDEAVDALKAGTVEGSPVVVTFDDGWESTLTVAAPVLKRYRIPATVYVTTYYCERDADVFNVVVYYMLWRTEKRVVELRTGHDAIDGSYDLTAGREAVGERWVKYANAALSWQERQALLGQIALSLGLNAEEVLAGRRFRNLSSCGVAELARNGFDIQLHTHRHRMPAEKSAFMDELNENRSRLESWSGGISRHFCYPSGEHRPDHPGWLMEAGMKSATTCESGSNAGGTGANVYLLRRYLDRDDMTELEFEAMLCGVLG